MDVKIEQKAIPKWKKYWYVMPIVVAIAVIIYVNSRIGGASFIVDAREIQSAVVEQGDFKVSIRGTGVLKPSIVRWVSSDVTGRVDEILVKSGARIEKGQPLLVLYNSTLQRELKKSRWELQAKIAENHAAVVNLESSYVELETTVLKAKLNYQGAKLKLAAENTLIKQGNTTVSALDFEQSKRGVTQKLEMWKAQEKRLKKMQQNIDASKEAYEARINQVKNDFKDKEARVAALAVRAPNSGIVQELTLKLGQKVNEGDKIAIVVSPESLIAELQIQELQIRDVVLGQKVMVDTRSSKIEGKVIRIDPAVIEGEVQVDVSLSGQLPPEARSDLNVDGLIAITDIENALFIKRPSFAQRYTSVSLYRISNDGRFATKVPVEFGQSSINQIQIVNGLSQGERLVISDTTSWEQHAEVLIN